MRCRWRSLDCMPLIFFLVKVYSFYLIRTFSSVKEDSLTGAIPITGLDEIVALFGKVFVSNFRKTGSLLQVVDDHEKVIHYDYTGTYQATVPPIMTAGQVAAYHRCSDKATLLWTPNQMSEDSVEHFIRVTMAVGVMARCLAGRSSVESPALVARIAGCDTTHMLACDILHRNKYNLTAALKDLVGKDLKASRSLLETFDDNDMEYFQTGLVETGRNLQAVHEDWVCGHSRSLCDFCCCG